MAKATQPSVDNLDAAKNNEEDITPEVTTLETKECDEKEDITPEVTTLETKECDEKEESTEGYLKVLGFVSGCDSLNLREEPNTNCKVVSVLRNDSEVIVYNDESTEEFYKVCSSAGVDGYCMKQYITLK